MIINNLEYSSVTILGPNQEVLVSISDSDNIIERNGYTTLLAGKDQQILFSKNEDGILTAEIV